MNAIRLRKKTAIIILSFNSILLSPCFFNASAVAKGLTIVSK